MTEWEVTVDAENYTSRDYGEQFPVQVDGNGRIWRAEHDSTNYEYNLELYYSDDLGVTWTRDPLLKYDGFGFEFNSARQGQWSFAIDKTTNVAGVVGKSQYILLCQDITAANRSWIRNRYDFGAGTVEYTTLKIIPHPTDPDFVNLVGFYKTARNLYYNSVVSRIDDLGGDYSSVGYHFEELNPSTEGTAAFICDWNHDGNGYPKPGVDPELYLIDPARRDRDIYTIPWDGSNGFNFANMSEFDWSDDYPDDMNYTLLDGFYNGSRMVWFQNYGDGGDTQTWRFIRYEWTPGTTSVDRDVSPIASYDSSPYDSNPEWSLGVALVNNVAYCFDIFEDEGIDLCPVVIQSYNFGTSQWGDPETVVVLNKGAAGGYQYWLHSGPLNNKVVMFYSIVQRSGPYQGILQYRLEVGGLSNLYLGDQQVDVMYLGGTPVDAAYLGTEQVYG